MGLFGKKDIWVEIKEFIDSEPGKAFVIRKLGNSYVVHPKGENLKSKTFK